MGSSLSNLREALQGGVAAMRITAKDHEVIDEILVGKWFRPKDLPASIRQPAARCARLEKLGVLISREVDEKKNTSCGGNFSLDNH